MFEGSEKKIKSRRCGIAKCSSGLVLVTVLWVVILLGVIVAAIGQGSRLDTRVSFANMQGMKLRWASRAGIDTAMAVLNEDTKASDNLEDLWSDNEDDFNNIEVDGCRFDVEVVDEASKLNINTATKKQLLGLSEMTEEIADSIIDWRDSDDTPSQAGVEGGYYQSLRYGYNIRNGPFETIRELLLVKWVNAELLYGYETRWIDYLTCYSTDNNSDVSAEKRININSANENRLRQSLEIGNSHARWIVENRPKGNGYGSIADLINENSPQKADDSQRDSGSAQALDLETFYRIADKITVTDDERIDGRVNINTASRVVLAALLGGGKEAEQLADNIITYRTSLADGMESIAEIMKVNSMKIDTFKEIAQYITTRSDIYSVYSTAMSQADRRGVMARLQTEVVADRGAEPVAILYWYQGVSN